MHGRNDMPARLNPKACTLADKAGGFEKPTSFGPFCVIPYPLR